MAIKKNRKGLSMNNQKPFSRLIYGRRKSGLSIMTQLRSKTILEAAVKEYIKSGQPISSRELAEKYDFGVKWASVRSELGKLTKEGFLSQLHTSGGRVPTDKGYQFFVENTLDNVLDSKKIFNSRFHSLSGSLKHGEISDFISEISDETKLLGVGQKEGERAVYKSGLNELFERLDFQTKDELCQIIRDFEMLDERIDAIRSRLFRVLSEPRVFIGRESPITKSDNLSVILDAYGIEGQRFLIAVIGPKRMDYDKSLKLLRQLHD